MSLRAQLAALALLVAMPLVALVAYRIYAAFRDDAARAADSVQRVARAAASDTRRTLDETERVLKRLAQHAPVRAMSAAQCDPAIEDFRTAVSGYANIITIDRGANLVCSAIQRKAARSSVGDKLKRTSRSASRGSSRSASSSKKARLVRAVVQLAAD